MSTKDFAFICISFIIFSDGFSQPDSLCHCAGMTKGDKHTLYASFGYNIDWFGKSDIHFKDRSTDDYDFTLYNVKAVDRTGLDNFWQTDVTIPQYSFRIGLFLNNKNDIGFELNYDHVKYVMVQDQVVHIKGDFRGTYLDKDTTLVSSFIRYEHTNGANYWMLNFVKRINLLHSKNEKHWLSAPIKVGVGIGLPRSDTWITTHHRNDTYHVAGMVFGLDAGFRYDFLKYVFFETSLKGCFVNFNNVLLYGDGHAKQHFWSGEFIFTLGLQIGVGKENKPIKHE